ncbi:MAG: 6-bladed beta-propeller [Longimicrobiales bacterium]|nr:6-bladed beta-propeller [Longimicrobiales bacterium]
MTGAHWLAWRKWLSILCALSALGIAGCDRGGVRAGPPEADTSVVIGSSVPFDEVFCAVDSVRLEQNERSLVASVQNIRVAPDGSVVITDISEGDVKVYRPDGRLRATLGAKGEGPGEFMAPTDAHLTREGDVAVADAALQRVQFFSLEGAFLRSIPVREAHGIRGFSTTPDGMVFVTSGDPATGAILLETDREGQPSGRHLRIADVRPEGSVDDGGWEAIRNFFLSVVESEVTVVSSVVPAVWSVDLSSEAVSVTSFEIPGYTPPRIPEAKELASWESDITEWFFQFPLFAFPLAGDDRLVLPMIRGWPWRADASVDLLYFANGEWRVLRDAPMPISITDHGLQAVRGVATDEMSLVRYSERCR